MAIVVGVRLSLADYRAYSNDIAFYGNGYLTVARGGKVGRRIAPADVTIRMPLAFPNRPVVDRQPRTFCTGKES